MSIELAGFKSFAKKTTLEFSSAITSVVGPNGSGKSNVAESFRFVLGEQSMKSMRGRRGEDLIWNGSAQVPRANRASVRLLFDNRDRGLNLDFDEVAIERVVHRGGVNEYLINGSTARLRDIAELLSQANIGGSGHHIISQGEADRILSAGSRERREMLEDALGLTQFLYKREEAQKKLEKTAENIKEVEGLRRELAPHLKFLGAQVKKIEQAQILARELLQNYIDYFKRESVYLAGEKAALHEAESAPKHEHAQLGHRIDDLRKQLSKKHDSGSDELIQLESRGRAAASRKDSLVRELGRLEGEIAAEERLSTSGTVPASEAKDFGERVIALAEGSKFSDIVALARQFLSKITTSTKSSRGELVARKTKLEQELKDIETEDNSVRQEIAALRKKIEGEKDQSRDAERELFAAMARRGELEVALAQTRARHDMLAREESTFKQDLGEAAALVGREVTEYENAPIDMDDEDRERQVERRRKLERQKIRLEESGSAGASDTLKEFEQTTERDEFLARELADLSASTESLNHLIAELTQTLETRFVQGVDKINKEFDEFFKLMFGGGTASLTIVKEKKAKASLRDARPTDLQDEDPFRDEEVQEGVEIAVSLPHKRVKGLHMLSGGERALTSIALIFAMSQVNPPPFLILDETDAALDEANSRRYGDMIETLAKHSQLIVITHNRETMSRAGVLYGITMGSDGVSKLLTVKFEEALTVAK